VNARQKNTPLPRQEGYITPGGVYILFGSTTADKSATQMEVAGLDPEIY